jgi:hypothetical protein
MSDDKLWDNEKESSHIMEKLLTAQEWTDMNAQALSDKNREVLLEMVDKINQTTKIDEEERFKRHWRMVFIAAAIESGKSSEEAINLSTNLMYLLKKKDMI